MRKTLKERSEFIQVTQLVQGQISIVLFSLECAAEWLKVPGNDGVVVKKPGLYELWKTSQ